MYIIFILLGISMTVAAGFLFSFLWAVRTGQYDDPDSPAVRILLDDSKTSGNTLP